ncbi:hypothetical protein B4W72_07595 [Staphylococcus delphini]|uniref:DUF3784 domain-containing protein n=1 Tax=Staphylococcus delphini TaxID=53344 RepID=A0A2A4GYW9_9STAP|nr:hypothetical protein [Staphylococcus delphini]PCF56753.1 hypothetical protein B5C08_01595 [Staphylococcus delphini]PCF62921.1 hypothetical protein B5C01_02095 [Staphylococcus delphini]PCF72623.1 hypothetical protein B4W72_07595 [Staphylococcus delphini]HEC2157844.1 hypothetical protein [Staphylococcus delphini]
MSYAVGISFTILILLTGLWFIIFNRHQPIIFFFSDKARTNILTGRSFLVLSLIYFIIVIILPVRISTMLLLYIGLTALDLIIMYILLKLEVIE